MVGLDEDGKRVNKSIELNDNQLRVWRSLHKIRAIIDSFNILHHQTKTTSEKFKSPLKGSDIEKFLAKVSKIFST